MVKAKVVRIITRLNIGGPAIHVILLSQGLRAAGYDTLLVAGRPSQFEGDMIDLAMNKGVRPVLVPTLAREISLKEDFASLRSIYEILKRERPDIVHTHTAKAGTLGRIAAILAGVPIKIHTFHGHVLEGYFSPLKTAVFLWIEKILALFSQRIVVISDTIKDDIVKRLKIVKPSKCAVIPLGFDLDPFLSAENRRGIFRKKLGVDDETLLVGIVGRLVPIKNHRLFLDAARQVFNKKLQKKVWFVVIGDGELRDELKDYAKNLGLDNRVIFTGWERDLASVYADLDIVVLSSINEGTPVSIIEAMASAKPVISTDVGGVKDVVTNNENGFLVKSGSIEELSSRISELLLDDEKRRHFGLKGREAVRYRYSSQRLISDIKRLYEECLTEKGR